MNGLVGVRELARVSNVLAPLYGRAEMLTQRAVKREKVAFILTVIAVSDFVFDSQVMMTDALR